MYIIYMYKNNSQREEIKTEHTDALHTTIEN